MTVPVYWVGGTTGISPTSSQEPTDAQVQAIATQFGLDRTRFSFVNVPGPAIVVPMLPTLTQKTALLTAMIEGTPGPFVLTGISFGAAVISAVLEELDSGVLQSRRSDLLMGFAPANPRRPLGATFPGGPNYGPIGSGCLLPNLVVPAWASPLWWEFGVDAGTYPGNNSMTGAAYGIPDWISSCPPGSASGPSFSVGVGDAVRVIAANADENATVAASLMQRLLGEAPGWGYVGDLFEAVGAFFSMWATGGASPHAAASVVQPFLASGDKRTVFQIAFDAINALKV